ncbi:MAG: uroporphyrinogen decarboxylase family protein [Anaerolineae bacterium]
MDSREIVQRTLAFDGPERVAASFPAPYWNDFCHTHLTLEDYAPAWRDVGGGRQEYVDAWGNTWARLDATSKGEVARGVLEDWADLERVPLPDLANPANFGRVRAVCQDMAETRYRIGGLPGYPFNLAHKMRRLDQFLADILLAPNEVGRLLGRIEELLAKTIVQYARAGVDGVMFPEDWGTQNGLMIHPRTWREVFKPGFEGLCGVAHAEGIQVLMHSCGKITDIIPDLIEAGIDALQFDQPRLHGLDALARFQGRITFWCPVDIQTTLQSGDEGAIVEEAHAMLAKLGGPRGGFIAGYYGDNVSIGIDERWQDVACRAFMARGDYRAARDG